MIFEILIIFCDGQKKAEFIENCLLKPFHISFTLYVIKVLNRAYNITFPVSDLYTRAIRQRINKSKNQGMWHHMPFLAP
jgi:hypothetical protein